MPPVPVQHQHHLNAVILQMSPHVSIVCDTPSSPLTPPMEQNNLVLPSQFGFHSCHSTTDNPHVSPDLSSVSIIHMRYPHVSPDSQLQQEHHLPWLTVAAGAPSPARSPTRRRGWRRAAAPGAGAALQPRAAPARARTAPAAASAGTWRHTPAGAVS